MFPKQKFINMSFKFVAILGCSGDFIFNQIGLTVKTYEVLHMISTGVDTSRDLLNGTYGSKPNMAKKLKFLEHNKFIEREVDNDDKRVFRFKITKKAKKALDKISPIYEENVAGIFNDVKEKDLKTAYDVIIKCLDNISDCKKTD